MTRSGTLMVHYWSFLETKEGQFLQRISKTARLGFTEPPTIEMKLDPVAVEPLYLKEGTAAELYQTWGISSRGLIVPAVVRSKPGEWVYRRMGRRGFFPLRHRWFSPIIQYNFRFDSELRPGGRGSCRVTYVKQDWGPENKMTEEPRSVRQWVFSGDYACSVVDSVVHGGPELKVCFENMRLEHDGRVVDFTQIELYLDPKSGVGTFDQHIYYDWRAFRAQSIGQTRLELWLGDGSPSGPHSISQREAAILEAEKAKMFVVAAIQAVSKMGEPAANRKHLQELVREAAGNGAKVVVLPEAAIPGYLSSDLKTTWQVGERKVTDGLSGIGPEQVAETVPGTSTQQFGKLADELNIYLTVPIIEFDPKANKYYNTLALMSPEGKLLLHYRKINPWPWAERGWATKGNFGNVFIDTPYGRMGLLICYDINYEPPNLKKLGIDHLLYSIAWVDSKRSDWFPERLPKLARHNNLNIIAANWTVPPDSKPNWYGYGKSRIINNQGRTVCKVYEDTTEEIIYAELKVPQKVQTPQPKDAPEEPTK